jgi:spore germination protein GerM
VSALVAILRSLPGRVATKAMGGLVVAALVAGCAIQSDTTPRDIPVADRSLSADVPAEGGAATGSTRVFLVRESDDGTARLRSVSRSVESTPPAVMKELLKGPNAGEDDRGITSALPRGLMLITARAGAGLMTVDLSAQMLDVPAPKLVLAIAQIVFTASQLEGVRAVRIQVDGTDRPWPDGQGQLKTPPLTVYDYPGLVESTQPAYPAIPSPRPSS